MDPYALASLCALLARGGPVASPHGVLCPPAAVAPFPRGFVDLRALTASDAARDAIARVTFAEAGDQGDSGLAAVVYTILNRLQDGRWGGDVDTVVNARGQFEPVMRVGGDWRRLPAVSTAGRARINTILNLALDGRLPDLTNGARFFQNPQIVAARVRAGTDSPGLVDFGGATPSAQIGAHRFYVDTPGGRGVASGRRRSVGGGGEAVMFVGQSAPAAEPANTTPSAPASRGADDPSHALFVRRDGQTSSAWP